MTDRMPLQLILSQAGKRLTEQMRVFGLICLGLLESLDNGLISATDAVQDFFYADNCLFVRKLRNKIADEIMSRGVHLSDLFDVLPSAESQREFKRELALMRALCLRLLEQKKSVA
jgi:hypothetical protein